MINIGTLLSAIVPWLVNWRKNLARIYQESWEHLGEVRYFSSMFACSGSNSNFAIKCDACIFLKRFMFEL
jgi:hypothetical protein